MPAFYRLRASDRLQDTIAVRIFALPNGLGGVVSWPLPTPGLRVFNPTESQPEGVLDALPYAQFLSEHLSVERITIEIDDDVMWHPSWGELLD
ncbi:hypothetical protein [Devosia sp. 2618]|uniref:hypothetical protein n=1 Tax=Devosia sp. 2618 TaxID=3156454 RepID=UPI0033981643